MNLAQNRTKHAANFYSGVATARCETLLADVLRSRASPFALMNAKSNSHHQAKSNSHQECEEQFALPPPMRWNPVIKTVLNLCNSGWGFQSPEIEPPPSREQKHYNKVEEVMEAVLNNARTHLSVIVSLFALMLGLLTLAPAPAAAAGLPLKNVTGVLSDGSRFDGTVRIDRFNLERVGDSAVVMVEGALRGVVTRPNGTTREIQQRFEAVADVSRVNPLHGVCRILDLDIGAIHLDLLGLVIDLSPIHLDIVAVPGGGLLGDLLCSLANLLDGPTLFGRIVRLLQEINDVLAGL